MGTFFQQRPDIDTAPLQGEAVLFSSTHNRFCVLNTTSSFIWSRLEAAASSEVIVRDLMARFDGVSEDEAQGDVDRILAEFVSLDLAATVD